MSSQSTATLQLDNLRVASLLIALAVKRGAYTIEEVDEVSTCYKNIKGFLDQWQKQQEEASETTSTPAPIPEEATEKTS